MTNPTNVNPKGASPNAQQSPAGSDPRQFGLGPQGTQADEVGRHKPNEDGWQQSEQNKFDATSKRASHQAGQSVKDGQTAKDGETHASAKSDAIKPAGSTDAGQKTGYVSSVVDHTDVLLPLKLVLLQRGAMLAAIDAEEQRVATLNSAITQRNVAAKTADIRTNSEALHTVEDHFLRAKTILMGLA